MNKKQAFITVTVVGVLALAAGLGVLIWWLVQGRYEYTIIELENDGFQDVKYTAAFTRIRSVGDMFWWFFPSTASGSANRPLLLWLDGLTGLPPSLLANFGMFGPLDFNLNKRNDSWIDEYNLLLVDAPLGTGFSTAFGNSDLATDLGENTDHILYTLEAFFYLHEEYQDAPLYIFGEGHGAQLALHLAERLAHNEIENFSHNLKGVVLGNGIISPALTLTKLGFYLEELGYVDAIGRVAIEQFSTETNALVNEGSLEEAFDKFLTLGEFINEEAGAVAANLGYLIGKLTQGPTEGTDYFGHKKYLQDFLMPSGDFGAFMEDSVATSLGISNPQYDHQREAALNAFRASFMTPTVDKVEHLLQTTNISVTIYNGNMDAVSNTPGQLEWVNSLQWTGQNQFVNSPRQTLIVNGLVEGYFRETERLTFYWMNAAGTSVPLDSPVAMRRVLQRITDN